MAYLRKRLNMHQVPDEELGKSLLVYTNLNPNNERLFETSYFRLHPEYTIQGIYDDFFKQQKHQRNVIPITQALNLNWFFLICNIIPDPEHKYQRANNFILLVSLELAVNYY